LLNMRRRPERRRETLLLDMFSGRYGKMNTLSQARKKSSRPATANLAAAVAIMAAISGCTEPRPAEFDYREEDKIFSIRSLRDASITINTGSQVSPLS